MKIIKRMFELSLTEKEARKIKRMMAIVMLPIMVFYMTSMNFLALEMMRATAEDAVVTTDPPAAGSSADEKKEEPAKEGLKVESKKEEVKKTPETPVKTENTVTDAAKAEDVADKKEDTAKTTTETTKTDVVPVPVADDKTENPEGDKKDEVKEATWVIDGKTASIGPVELNKTYKAPQNDQVTVTFSKLPEKAGNLTIKEIKLSAEEQATLGSLTDTAYDITSDMENGTFEYDLTLPYPDKKNNAKVEADDVQVLYTEKDEIKKEDLKNVSEDKKVAENANDTKNIMELKGLDHFTIFVVIGTKTESFDESSSDVVINEFLYDGSEWVELFNKTSNTVDLTSWKICELTSAGTENCHSLSGSITGDGFFTKDFSTLLNNDGDTITLKNSSDTIISQVTYDDSTIVNGQDVGNVSNGQSIARTTNGATGSNVWVIASSPTKNYSNDSTVYVDDSNTTGNEFGTEEYPFNTIQEGITAVATGGTVDVKNGTYSFPSTLTINKEVALEGESEGGVILDASSLGTSYGIQVSASDVTIKKLTLLPPIVSGSIGTSSGGAYPIHVSNTPNLVSNLTLEDITIENSNRTAFDIHGVDGGTLKNLTARNSAYGNGLSLTGSSNITVEGMNTSGNAWGGIALYNSKYTSPQRATSNITLKGETFSIGEENGIYEENEFGLTITGIDAQGYDYKVTNNEYKAGAENFVHYQKTLDDAKAFALTLQTSGPNTASVIKQISTGDYYVAEGMKIQNAIDAASADDTINVTAGTYNEKINIDKSLTINGAKTGVDARTRDTSFGESILDGTGLSGSQYDAIMIANGVSDVVIDGFEIRNYVGTEENGVGSAISSYCMSTDTAGSSDVTVKNNYIHDVAYNGILVGSENTVGESMVVQNGWTIQYNKIAGYKYAGVELTNVTNSQVKDNNIVAPSDIFNDPGDAGVGIEIAARSRAKAVTAGTNVEVSGNAITGTFPDGSRAAVNFLSRAYGATSNAALSGVTVSGNNISGATNVRAAILAVSESRGNGPATISNLSIANNILDGNSDAINIQDYIRDGVGTATHSSIAINGNDIKNSTGAGLYLPASTSAEGITVNSNKITSNALFGINNEGINTLDAEENWWGTDNAAEIMNKISGDVDYDPWCMDESCSTLSDSVYSENETSALSDSPQDINVGGLTIDNVTGEGNIFVAKYDGTPSSGGLSTGANGFYYDIQYSGSVAFPINIEISYDDSFDENHFVSLYYYKGGAWHDYKLDTLDTTGYEPSTVDIDKDGNKITASLQHLTPIVPGLDTTAPSVPTGGTPNSSYVTTNNFDFDWNDSTDDNDITYEFQSSLNPAQAGGILTTGLWHSGVLPTSMIHSSGAPDGTWYWQVRAIDEFGNTSAWSEIWNVTIDTHAPAKPTGLKRVTPSGSAEYACGAIVQRQTLIPVWDDMAAADSSFDHYEYASFQPNGSIGTEQTLYTNRFNHSWVPTADGTNGYVVRTVDKAGNASDWALSGKTLAGSCQITYDSTRPTVDLVFSGTGSGVTSFQAVFNEDVNEADAENPVNYFLDNWPGAGGSGNLDGHANISYDSSSRTATITLTTSGWYISPEQEWGVENVHDLAGNIQSVNPYSETSTAMVAPSAPGTPISTPNPTNNILSQIWSWAASTDIGGSGVKGYFWNVYNVISSSYSGWTSIGNVLGVTTSLLDGQYQLQVKSQDNAGNESGVVNSATLTVDSVAPVITIDSYITTLTNDDITVTASTNEGTLNTTSHIFTANGSFDFVATDDAGNTTTRTVTITNIDKTLPVVSITAPAASASVSGTVAIRGTVTEDHPHHYWLAIYKKSNGQQIYSTTVNHSDEFADRLLYSWNTIGKSDGVYQIKFAERDAADNRSADFVTEITVDNTAPTATISYDTTAWTSGSVVATLNPSEPVTVTNNSGNTTYTFTDNGTFIFEFVDAAGNSGSATATVNNIDKTGPSVPVLVSPIGGVYINDNTPLMQWDDSSDTGGSGMAGYEYQVYYNCSNPSNIPGSCSGRYYRSSPLITISQLQAGTTADNTYYWQVRAKDNVGNFSAWSGLEKIVIDTHAPTFSSKTTFSGWYNTVPQTSSFHYTDTNMADGYTDPTCDITTEGANQTCSITPVSNVCDKAGNCNTTTVVSNGANIDFTDPTSIITSPSDGEDGVVYLNEWDGTLAGTADDGLSGVRKVELKIQRNIDGSITYWNGTDWQTGETLVQTAGTTSWTYGPLALPLVDGEYNIESHATDNAGNMENTFTLKIILDKTIPTISLSINPADPDGDNNWYDSVPEITLSATDSNLDRIEYQIDSTSGTWIVYSTPVKIDDGEHVFYYRSIDKAGNISNVGVKNVKVDTRDPDNVRNLDADYDRENNEVKLSWDADDSDIDEVYIYRGRNKEFHVGSSSRIATQDDSDETYTDDDVELGEKYYYKFVARDDAGNKSDVKVVSIKISESGEITVTDEGTEVLPRETVLGEQSEETQVQQNTEENNDENGQVAGDESSGENSIQTKKENWPYWVTGGILVLIAGIWWWMRRRRGSANLPVE